MLCMIVLLFNIIVVNLVSSKCLLTSDSAVRNSFKLNKDLENNLPKIVSVEKLTRLNENYNSISRFRGGEVISGKKKKSLIQKIKDVLSQVQPATRVYLLLCLFCTIVHMTGLPAPTIFALDMSKLYEIWRPFTSIAYLGGPSMSMANSLYFLIRYGQTLEEGSGTGVHTWFLLIQTLILSILGLLFSFPLQAQAMIAAIVFVSSRINAMEKIPIQFGIVITSWQLPYCMLLIDCLSQQNIAAAWPHVLGILSGHIYHFYTKVWPSLGGKEWLKTPKWILKRLGDQPLSNIKGMDFRRDNINNKDQLKSNKLYKNKFLPKKKGRKLGK